MNNIAVASHRFTAFCLATVLTLAMLGGVDFLATMDVSHGAIVASARAMHA